LLFDQTLPKAEQHALHWFLIACTTGLRYSDWFAILSQLDNAPEEPLYIGRQTKTEKPLVIPKQERLQRLLAFQPETLHKISSQKARDYIKSALKMADIPEAEKYGTHAGRDTFVMIAYHYHNASIEDIAALIGDHPVTLRKHYFMNDPRYLAKKVANW
jgi:hypothetical protein